MGQSTAQTVASILVAEGEYEDSLTWPELVDWVNKSAAVERLILIATERATGNVFHGELAEACDKGLNLVLQVPEQFTRVGLGWRTAGYAEYVIRTSLHALLPMRLKDGSVEVKMDGRGEFDFRICPHGAIECPRPNQQR
ncbi:hypothetical protein D4R49_00510 [bacterium]|nr:MAG: hypothetical protein D4R49_00510 [bacterium]